MALSGGIASGKSTVAALFEQLGAPVFDADIVARTLVSAGQPALAEIATTFGGEILTPTGALDRRKMRELVFENLEARQKLEAILHPRIRDELRRSAEQCSAAYCILAIPLLAESWHAYAWVDRVLVVDVPETVQLQRLMQRDDMTLAFAQRMLGSQSSRQQRLALAHDVIDNAGLPSALAPIVARLDQQYRNAASKI